MMESMSSSDTAQPVAPPPTCVTCEHFRRTDSSAWGYRCGRAVTVNPVTGDATESGWHCWTERSVHNYHDSLAFYVSRDPCGPGGKHWKPRSAVRCFEDRVAAGDPETVALLKGPPTRWQRFTRWITSLPHGQYVPTPNPIFSQ